MSIDEFEKKLNLRNSAVKMMVKGELLRAYKDQVKEIESLKAQHNSTLSMLNEENTELKERNKELKSNLKRNKAIEDETKRIYWEKEQSRIDTKTENKQLKERNKQVLDLIKDIDGKHLSFNDVRSDIIKLLNQ